MLVFQKILRTYKMDDPQKFLQIGSKVHSSKFFLLAESVIVDVLQNRCS